MLLLRQRLLIAIMRLLHLKLHLSFNGIEGWTITVKNGTAKKNIDVIQPGAV